MKLALFGGAFDPVHNAHLVIAREAARAFALDRVLFVPTANPPHKQLHASYEDRFRMLELALEGEPAFEASRLEAGTANTYSIETLERLRPSLAPEDRLYFISGADAFAEIRTWVRWRDVISAVEFIVVSRPGAVYNVPEGATVHRLDSINLPVSSTEIRRRLAAGNASEAVPPRVLDYVKKRNLYR